MKIQYKINLVSLGILIAVATAVSAAGVLTIEQLGYDLNRKLLATELETVVEDLEDVHLVLAQSGVANAPGYVKSAQQATLKDLAESQARRFGHLAVIDSGGAVILHESIPAGTIYELECLPGIMEVKKGVTKCAQNGEWLLFHQRFPQWGWTIILSASNEEMTAMRTEFLRQVILIVAFSILAGGLILLALTRGIVWPIQQLAKAAMNLSKGRFDQALPEVRGSDEVAELNRAFKIMSGNLASAHHDLECQTIELTLANKELNQQVADRKKAESELADLNRRLEQLVAERTRELAQKADELEKANRRLLELDEMKSSFLSSVSHELRTPLTSVRGFAKMILRDFIKYFNPMAKNDSLLKRKGQRILSNLQIIESEGARLTRMINDVLDLNKIESGRLEWDDRLMDPALIIRQATCMLNGMFEGNAELRFINEVPPSLPLIRIDPDRFEQVLINLLNNAVKFTARGSVTLRAEASDGMLRVIVDDTGEGIPAAELETIFDKFHQVRKRDTLNRISQGTGLGLAICKQIVTHYGGRILVESAPGIGSVFTVELPLAPIDS